MGSVVGLLASDRQLTRRLDGRDSADDRGRTHFSVVSIRRGQFLAGTEGNGQMQPAAAGESSRTGNGCSERTAVMELDPEEMDRAEVLAHLREVLVKRADALEKALAGDLGELQRYNRDTAGDMLDLALDAAQYEINSELVSVQSRELARTREALKQMAAGTYGLCSDCSDEIGLGRLVALPYTTTCIGCARAAETEQHLQAPHYSQWDRSRDEESITAGETDD